MHFALSERATGTTNRWAALQERFGGSPSIDFHAVACTGSIFNALMNNVTTFLLNLVN
jgi:hypothetical protein